MDERIAQDYIDHYIDAIDKLDSTMVLIERGEEPVHEFVADFAAIRKDVQDIKPPEPEINRHGITYHHDKASLLYVLAEAAASGCEDGAKGQITYDDISAQDIITKVASRDTVYERIGAMMKSVGTCHDFDTIREATQFVIDAKGPKDLYQA